MSRGRSGFTLVEVLVAFAIAGVLLTALFDVLSRGVSDSARAATLGEALLVAQSTLEGFGAYGPLPEQHELDRQEGRFRVRASARPFAAEGVDTSQVYIAPWEIVVTVSWRDGAAERSTELRTVRLALKP